MRTMLTLAALLVALMCGACGEMGSGIAPSSLPGTAGARD
jgi:hypothetical protein